MCGLFSKSEEGRIGELDLLRTYVLGFLLAALAGAVVPLVRKGQCQFLTSRAIVRLNEVIHAKDSVQREVCSMYFEQC